MESAIVAVICFLFSLAAFYISFRSFQEKGFLLNNAYLYASKEERARMDKKPHYRQTAIVFLLLGILFSLIGAQALLHDGWIFAVTIAIAVITVIYAIASSILYERKKR